MLLNELVKMFDAHVDRNLPRCACLEQSIMAVVIWGVTGRVEGWNDAQSRRAVTMEGVCPTLVLDGHNEHRWSAPPQGSGVHRGDRLSESVVQLLVSLYVFRIRSYRQCTS